MPYRISWAAFCLSSFVALCRGKDNPRLAIQYYSCLHSGVGSSPTRLGCIPVQFTYQYSAFPISL
jgi:hypothetical protein